VRGAQTRYLDDIVSEYLRSTDEPPHRFQLRQPIRIDSRRASEVRALAVALIGDESLHAGARASCDSTR
jgi:hypothetical protein